MHGISIGDPARPMRIRGQAALAYARDSWGRDDAKYVGIWPNPVDEVGIFPATRDQVEDVASEDQGLVYAEFPREVWDRWVDQVIYVLQTTAADIEWDGGVDPWKCNWEEFIPEWMMDFQSELVGMAHQVWLCQVDGGEGGQQKFNAMCPRHALAQAAAWVVKGDWPLPGSVVVEVKALKGARGEGFNYARLVVVGPDPLPR